MSRAATRGGAAVLAAVILAGCGAHESPPRAGGTRAAEPAVAPPPTVRPAGRSLPVGAAAEGVVADPVTHVVAVGTRDPDQLVLVDARGGRVRGAYPCPDTSGTSSSPPPAGRSSYPTRTPAPY